MNKAQTLLLSSALTLGTVFAAHAQTAANDDGKLIAANEPVKTEVVADNKKVALEPRVREGAITDALLLSHDHKMLVVYISGGKGKPGQSEPLTAQQYAERLVVGFKDKQYTKYPTNIAVVWEETGKDRITVAEVLINGKAYTTQKGHSVFTPIQIADNMDLFTTKYMQTNGLATLDSSSPGLASNQPN